MKINMRVTKGKMITGEEYDMLSRYSRRILGAKPGRAKAAKRQYNKRIRRHAKAAVYSGH